MADTAFGEIKLLKTNKKNQTETEKTHHTHKIHESIQRLFWNAYMKSHAFGKWVISTWLIKMTLNALKTVKHFEIWSYQNSVNKKNTSKIQSLNILEQDVLPITSSKSVRKSI